MFRQKLFALVPALMLLATDRTLKNFFLSHPAVRIGGDFFYSIVTLHMESNAGIAFGVMVPRAILLLLSAAIIFFTISFSIRSKSPIVAGAGMLIVGGAVSNFYDRIRYGVVIDYIDVRWFTVLNIADVMISVGAALLILVLWRDSDRRSRLDTSDKVS